MSEQNKFSCDNKGDGSSAYSLMKQQQIVRDYMNLYTDLIWVKNKLGLTVWNKKKPTYKYS